MVSVWPAATHLNPLKILQKEVIFTQKQPGCKKGAALFKMVSMKKVVKSKGAAKNGYDGVG